MADFYGANIPTMVDFKWALWGSWTLVGKQVRTIRSCEQVWMCSNTPLFLGFLQVSSSLSAWLCNLQQSNRHSRSTCYIPRWCICSWEMLREEEISSNTQLRETSQEILQSKCLLLRKSSEKTIGFYLRLSWDLHSRESHISGFWSSGPPSMPLSPLLIITQSGFCKRHASGAQMKHSHLQMIVSPSWEVC